VTVWYAGIDARSTNRIIQDFGLCSSSHMLVTEDHSLRPQHFLQPLTPAIPTSFLKLINKNMFVVLFPKPS